MTPLVTCEVHVRQRWVSVERLEEVARNAILGGYGKVVPYLADCEGLVARRRVSIDCAMDCESPGEFELWARWSATHGKSVRPIGVHVRTRCRKCFLCKRRKSMFWAGRAVTEYQLWPRTLMGTFTMSLDSHNDLDYRITARLARGRVDFRTLSEEERFAERCKEFGYEVTKWFKRLRKGDASHVKPQFRYLLVAERHDSEFTGPEMRGRPHFHVLLHEMQAGALVRGSPQAAIAAGRIDTWCDVEGGEYECRMVRDRRGRWVPAAFVRDDAFIRKNWTFGHTKFQWASNANSAFYVCKYLTKAMSARVRASEHYGAPDDVVRSSRVPRVAKGSEDLSEREI